MNKNITALVIVLILGGLAAFFIIRSSKSTIREDLRNFAVKDTGNISRIFLADRIGNRIDLKRQDRGWVVNDKFPARSDAIQTLLNTIYMVEVKSPVAKAARENVIMRLASNSTKVEIYRENDDEPAKIYYVGNATRDGFGTYMMIENSASPFITHIPGFYGYLSTRYFIQENMWRSTDLFTLHPTQIKSIEVVHYEKPKKNFRLDGIRNEEFVLTYTPERLQYQHLDTQAVYDYVTLFADINGEFWVDSIRSSRVDSILQNPIFDVKVTLANGQNMVLKAFKNPLEEGSLDLEGNPMEFDPDRLYAFFEDEKNWIVIQYFTFDLVTQDYDFFLQRTPGRLPQSRNEKREQDSVVIPL